MRIAVIGCSFVFIVALWSVAAASRAYGPDVPVVTVSGDRVKAHDRELSAIAMSQDGRWLASGSHDRTIKLWSLPSGDLVHRWTGHKNSITDVAFSPDGRFVAAASADKTVSLWSVDQTNQTASLTGHRQSVRTVRFSPDGRLLITASDKELKTWSMPDGKPLAVVANPPVPLDGASFMSEALMAFPYRDAIQFVSLPDLQRRGSVTCGKGENVRRIAISGDGTRLVAVCPGGMRAWSLPNRQLETTIVGDGLYVNALTVNEDATLAATGDGAGVVRIWNLKDGRVTATFKDHGSAVVSMALSRDGRTLATGALDSRVRLWSTTQSSPLAIFKGHRGGVDHLHFTPDSATLVSAQEPDLQITEGWNNEDIPAGSARKINQDALIALWDTSPPKFRRLLGK